MSQFASTALRRRPLQAFVLALWLVGTSAAVAAQECPELPAVPKPAPRNCGFLSLGCKNEAKQEQDTWQNQMRRFSDPIPLSNDEGQSAVQSIELPIGGCRGSIVNLELNATRLRGLRYELVAPSGTSIAAEDFALGIGRAMSRPIRLPESGFYRLRLTISASPEGRERCTKWNNKFPPACISQEPYTAFPYAFELGFRGNAEAPALRLGEQGEGTVTPAEPLSRRFAVEGGQRVRARVVATGGQIACRGEAPDGSSVAAAPIAGGCEVNFPERDLDVTYVLALSAASNAAVGVSIFSERTGSAQAKLTLDTQTDGMLELSAPPGSPALSGAKAEWSVVVPVAGNYLLTVVPSGLARLELEVVFYNPSTEEVFVDRMRAASRKVFAVSLPAAGTYVLRVTPLAYDAQSAQGKAKYTLLMQKSP